MQTQKQRDRGALIQPTADSTIHLSTAQTAGLHLTIIDVPHYQAQTAIPTFEVYAESSRTSRRQRLGRQTVDRLTGCGRRALPFPAKIDTKETPKICLIIVCVAELPSWSDCVLSTSIASVRCGPLACARDSAPANKQPS